MKKVIGAILAALLVCTMLTGCRGEGDKAFVSKRFEIIDHVENFNYQETFLYDRETGVMYVWVRAGYGGGLSPLYDADGNVMIYEG